MDETILHYYINECPHKPNYFYCTARITNTGVEKGHLQYNINPEILKKNIINNVDIENNNIIIEENTESNLKRLLPKTNSNSNLDDWKLLLIIKYKDNNDNWIKGALLNKKTNLIALMTSSKGKQQIIENGNRAIQSYDPEWYVGHYRLIAPLKFWHELIKRLNMENDKNIEETEKHNWTEDETKIICKMYIENKTPDEIHTKLSNIKLSSIKMKYNNCLYLDKGDVNGSLKNVSKLHSKIWQEIKQQNKKNININKLPKIKKQEIWSTYIGLDIGKTKCLCCNLNDITQFEFHSAHIIPKSKGGDNNIENLRPICSLCNLSMSNKNLIDFMIECGYSFDYIKLPKPKQEEKKVIIKCKMRNNQYGKHNNVFDTIIYTKKLICPWGHWKDSNELFNEGKFRDEKFSNIFINYLSCEDLVCIFDRKYDYGLIVKIISEPITEKLKEIIIVRNNKCYHKPMLSNCNKCNESVELILTDKYYKDNYQDFIKYINEDYQFENMYAIIRRVEIIGKINDNSIFYTLGKRLQNSICRCNEEILEKNIYN